MKCFNKMYPNNLSECFPGGYPMYAGDPNQFKKLKTLYMNPFTVATKPIKPSPQVDVYTNFLVDGRNPVMLLNELYNGHVQYDTYQLTGEDGELEHGVTATMDSLTMEGKGLELFV